MTSLVSMPGRILARRRARAGVASDSDSDSDSGFIMIYVMMVILIITALVGGTLVVTAANVVPTVQSNYDQAAQAAAQAGLNQFVANANTQCADGSHSTVASCGLGSTGAGTVYSASGYSSTYTWKAAPDPQGRYFRVTSTGLVKQNGVSASRTLIGDIAAGASSNPLDFGVITAYETQSPADVLAEYPARNIAFDAAGVANATVPISNNTVGWTGASAGTAAGDVAYCNATLNGGRASNPPPRAPYPYVDWTETTTSGNHYTNYEPCQTSWGHSSELLPAANSGDGAGGYFSQDAMLLSNSYPGGTGPLFNQPVTTKYSFTGVDAGVCGTAAGQNYRSYVLSCVGYPLELGGSPSPSSAYTPQIGPGPTISTSAVTIPSSACLYNGPTRVKLNGNGTATVTSPQTTSAFVAAGGSGHPSACYTGAGASGMFAQTVSLSGISIISVQNDGNPPTPATGAAHSSTGWPVTGQYHGATTATGNSVFYATQGALGTTNSSTYTGSAADKPYTPAVGDNPNTHAGGDGAWTPQWTSFTAGTSCTTSTNLTDLKFFNCYQSGGAYSATAYSTMKAKVQAALATNASSYNTTSALQTYLTSLLAAGNSADANNANPSNADNTSHRWRVTVTQDAATTDGCTPVTGPTGNGGGGTATPPGAPSTDSLIHNDPGAASYTITNTKTCLTAAVTLQVGTCNVALLLGVCVNLGNFVWGNGTALLGGGASVSQFTVTTTNSTSTTATTITKQGVSSFPNTDDVTQYAIGSGGTFGANGPGDLYVEGTSPTTIALHAQDDVIVTGDLAPTNGLADAQTPVANPTAAIEVIAQNNVRVYHPVQCLASILTNSPALVLPTATTPGFCPDDITGLYTGVPANGARPDQQYTNMRPDLANLTVMAAVFALGNAAQSVSCPEPTGGNGQCGGEFVTDNYNRGDSVGTAALGYVTVIGTLAMAHHAPVGEEWEITDTSGQSSRPYSGYQFAERYQNVKTLLAANSAVNALVPTGPSTPTPWHILSTSIVAGSGS